jgi:hypothetical protein
MPWNALMQEDPSKSISQFLAQLESHDVTLNVLKPFLTALPVLPLDLPLLQGIGKYLSGDTNNIVTKNIDRRYRRIAFVQQSLEKINFSKAKPDSKFEDFIFAQSDFSIYEKIDAETFQCFYIDGLDDLSDDFFTRILSRNKSEIQNIISARFKLVDGFYVSDGNPFLISILRSIHTSLDFAPFPNQNQCYSELEKLLEFLQKNVNLPDRFFQYLAQEEDDLFCALLGLFDKTEIMHRDGMKSRFVFGEENGNAALFIVYHPHGKAYTKLTAHSKLPFCDVFS